MPPRKGGRAIADSPPAPASRSRPERSIPAAAETRSVRNPANFNPDDPSTWPAITLATPTAQPQAGQPQQGVAQRPGLPGFSQQPTNGLGQLAGTRRQQSTAPYFGRSESLDAERPGGSALTRSIARRPTRRPLTRRYAAPTRSRSPSRSPAAAMAAVRWQWVRQPAWLRSAKPQSASARRAPRDKPIRCPAARRRRFDESPP